MSEERRVAISANTVLAQLGFDCLSYARADQLSFGQRKLTSFAGALAAEVAVLLLDEPFTGLDPEKAQRVADSMRRLADEGRHVLFVEHNLAMVSRVAARVLALDRGRLIADGRPEHVLGSDLLAEAYLR